MDIFFAIKYNISFVLQGGLLLLGNSLCFNNIPQRTKIFAPPLSALFPRLLSTQKIALSATPFSHFLTRLL